MKEKYLVSRNNYNGDIVISNALKGYIFNPKNNINYGIKINEVIVVKPSLIEMVIKRKIKNKLDYFLKFIVEENDDTDDSRIALGELQKYKAIVNKKYNLYLDNKYLDLLNKKFDVIERELKSSVIYNNLELDEVHKSR